MNIVIIPADYAPQSQNTDSPKEEPLTAGRSSEEKTPRYKRVSRDGDTLEISAASKSKITISDTNLASFSESRTKQLYNKKEITKRKL